MAKAKTKPFPKTIYCKREADCSDPDISWLVPEDDEAGCAEMGQKVRIGVYQLVETRELEGVVKIHSRKLSAQRA